MLAARAPQAKSPILLARTGGRKVSSVAPGFSPGRINPFFWLPKKFKQQNKWSWCIFQKNYSNILLIKTNFMNNRLICCNHTFYCVCMVPMMSASHNVTSAPRYQSRSSVNIRDLIPRYLMVLAEAVPMGIFSLIPGISHTFRFAFVKILG